MILGQKERSISSPATTASGGTTGLPATRRSSSLLAATTAPGISGVSVTATAPGVSGVTTGSRRLAAGTVTPVSGITTSNIVILLRGELEVLQLFALGHELLKELGDLLLGLKQSANEDRGQGLITLRVERGCQAAVANTASTTCRELGINNTITKIR